MKKCIDLFLLGTSALFAVDRASFASQSDLVADLLDAVLENIYHVDNSWRFFEELRLD